MNEKLKELVNDPNTTLDHFEDEVRADERDSICIELGLPTGLESAEEVAAYAEYNKPSALAGFALAALSSAAVTSLFWWGLS